MNYETLLPTLCLCARGVVYGENVSQPYLCICSEYFLIHQMCIAAQLVSGFLSEGIAPCKNVDSVYLWEKLSLGASYIII